MTESMANETATPTVEPLVTVITVVRNEATTIERTVESVLSQTYPRVEYVVVDGASADATVDILRRYEDRIDKLVSEPDRGIPHALNKGVELAGGDLLLFMNAGDRFADDNVLRQAIELIPPDVDLRRSIIYGDALYVHASGTEFLRTSHEELQTRNSICHQSVLLGADVQRENSYDERLFVYMDYDLWLRCLGRYRFVKLPLTLSVFTSGGASSGAGLGAELEVERGLVQMLNDRGNRRTGAVLHVLGNVVASGAKRRARRALGDSTFLSLKRRLGRDTPSVWTAPPGDGETG
jgi:glycosyltransferase involved in cell wall biosynthesis